MFSFSLFGRELRIGRKVLRVTASVIGVALMGTLFLVEPALAQGSDGLLNWGGAADSIARELGGLFKILRLVIVAVALIYAFINFFKASKGGQSRGWINGLVLLIVAGIAIAPGDILRIIGLEEVADVVDGLLEGSANIEGGTG